MFDSMGKSGDEIKVPVEHMDYGYIEKCTDAKELRAILEALQSGKEGRWFDLERACEKQMLKHLPAKEKRLYLAMRTEPDQNEVEEAKNELGDFLSKIRDADQALKKKKGTEDPESIFESENSENQGGNNFFPPVRGGQGKEKKENRSNIVTRTPEEIERAEKQRKERIPGSDFRAWDKFDVESELERIDKEEAEERRRREEELNEKQAAIDERKRLQKQSGKGKIDADRLNKLSKEQRIFFSNREKEKGNECFKACEYEDALECYTKSIELLPSDVCDPKPFANRAMACLKLELWQRAEEDCTRAIELDPTFTKSYARRGMARHRRGKYLDAIDDFEEALHLEPKNTKLNGLLAESRKQYQLVGGIGADRPGAPPRNQSQAASKPETFKKMVILEDSDSSDEEEEDISGGAAKEEEKIIVEEKEEKLVGQQTIKEEEKVVDQQTIKEEEKAVVEQTIKQEVVKEEDKKDRDWVEFKRQGAEAFRNGDITKALRFFSSAVETLEQDHPMETEHLCNCLGNKAVCFKQLEQWDNVETECNKILAIDNKHVKALFRRGIAHEERGNKTEALNDMCQVLRLDPNQREAGEKISVLMGNLNNKPEPVKSTPPQPAQNSRSEKIEIKPAVENNKPEPVKSSPPQKVKEENVDTLKKQGNALFKEGNIAGALEFYNKCLRLEPTNPSVLSNKAMALLKLQKFEECVFTCSAGLKSKSTLESKFLFRRAMGYKGLGQYEKALHDLEIVVKNEPNNSQGKVEFEIVGKVVKSNIEKQRLEEKRKQEEQTAERAKGAVAKARSKGKFAVPKTSYEFEKAWRSLQIPSQQAEYLLLIPPKQLKKKIFRVDIPEEMLMGIVQVLD
eukprot:CAMPEP_0203751070 /NCGR_PEP_ID=MMETSP0098-20131031/5202_1 /ASSEMBLY_ACC=CAM_ASM_000208 /TAXON_ID=96639 /ORGANISM=" , Strain NY0313808BC1" /LENGTH=853 /DNA_ID=CAMNT_0050640633 /DNA_START=320 /DNA_END=2878 /DNA_ORIENTATION=-